MPPRTLDPATTTLSVKLPVAIAAAIRAEAKGDDRTVSAIIRRALVERFAGDRRGPA